MRPPVRLDQVRHLVAAVLRQLTSDAFEEDFAELCTALLSILDEECRRRLVSGRPDVFGSIQSLQQTFSATMQRLAPRLQLPPADLADHVFMTDLFQAVLGELQSRGDLVFATDRQRARSRVFEFVHYLRNLRQRTSRGERDHLRPRLVEMVKVEVRERERAVRDVGIDDFLEGIGDLPYEADNPRFQDLR